MIRYLVTYLHDHSNTPGSNVFLCKPNATFRELQQKFDPNYYYNSLKFFPLGDEIKL